MRYQNWDVLVFPDESKIPLQEFKTNCQVIQDPESHNFQLNPLLLPAVTSFVPGLLAGAPFRISIHCWQNPDFSRYIHNLMKPSDEILFEGRLFIDGRIVGSKWFNQHGPWPTVIDLSIDLDKHGDFEKLKFPTFHKELLSQNYWNAGDDLGRIKVVISEGFSRDSSTYPFERIKNIVSFSFQHAPLHVLEASSIAWPNAAMWRQVSIVGPYVAQQHQSPRKISDEMDLHSHSPRHVRHHVPFPRTACPRPSTSYDPFTEPTNPTFTAGTCRHTCSDTSMPDYSNTNTRTNSSRQVTDPMSIDVPQKAEPRFDSMGAPGAYESVCEALMPSAPVNTPQTGEPTPATTSIRKLSGKIEKEPVITNTDIEEPDELSALPLATSATGNVKSRKESKQISPYEAESNALRNESTMRKVSQPLPVVSNGKRQRILTAAAAKVIDEEDEPRTSPSMRKASSREREES